MAIRVTLDRVLLDRRMSLTELGDRVGITLANLSILKTGKAKAIRFSTLEALCRELGCQPGDILVWEPGEASDEDSDDEEEPRGKAVAAE
jgi:putative transcriptional regulator